MKPEDKRVFEACYKKWRFETESDDPVCAHDFKEFFQAALAHRDAHPAVAQEPVGFRYKSRSIKYPETGWSGWHFREGVPDSHHLTSDDNFEYVTRLLYDHSTPAVAVNEQDRLDAARYRWLRDSSVPPHNFYLSVPVEFDGVKYTPQEVDNYIDAAIEAAKGGAS